MKKLLYLSLAVAPMFVATGCIEEIDPQSNTVTAGQVESAPNAVAKLTAAITNSMSGQFSYSGDYSRAYDYGYTSFMIMRDVMGQDMVNNSTTTNWYSTWEFCGTGLGPGYAVAQMPITCFYGWIKDCNNVLNVIPAEPTDEERHYSGIAHTMRAFYYMDLARVYCPTTYGINPQAQTAPIVTEKTTAVEATNNPRATNEVMWNFILSDLDAAEAELADFDRGSDNTLPDLSVVYGLKARAYLTMEDWEKAETYAKLAQKGYTAMTAAQYNDRVNGFNSPNGAWMFSTKFKSDDPAILQNDADTSWGSWMILEITEVSGCGYAANYGAPFHIDRHLYNTIPESDCRKDCFVSFDVPDMSTEDALAYVQEHYSDYPSTIVNLNAGNDYEYGCGGASVKFRAAGGEEGHNNQYIGFCVSVPLMRVEEMMLIEAEAAGMQEEGRGIQLLTTFAQLRDPDYVYGTHNESYQSDYATAFQNEVWWQRRVELWGEGLATFDIKRLNKGIIRSYEGTNHVSPYQWNTTTPPQWMTFCFVDTEAAYNTALEQNPTPIKPEVDSPKYNF